MSHMSLDVQLDLSYMSHVIGRTIRPSIYVTYVIGRTIRPFIYATYFIRRTRKTLPLPLLQKNDFLIFIFPCLPPPKKNVHSTEPLYIVTSYKVEHTYQLTSASTVARSGGYTSDSKWRLRRRECLLVRRKIMWWKTFECMKRFSVVVVE